MGSNQLNDDGPVEHGIYNQILYRQLQQEQQQQEPQQQQFSPTPQDIFQSYQANAAHETAAQLSPSNLAASFSISSQQQQQQQLLLQQQQEAQQAEMVQAAIAAGNGEEVMEQLLQQIMLEQQIQQRLEQERLEQERLEAIRKRPKEHLLTVTQNGTIIAATETITGESPNALLMTSIYEGVHHEDLPHLHATKERLWDRGDLRITINLRRRNLEGEWIWLDVKVASFADYPVPSFVLHESCANDSCRAAFFARVTRNVASLAEAIDKTNESSRGGVGGAGGGVGAVGGGGKASNGADERSDNLYGSNLGEHGVIPGLADDAARLQALLDSVSDPAQSTLRQLLDQALMGGTCIPGGGSVTSVESGSTDGTGLQRAKRVEDDAPSLLDLVRSGAGLSLGGVLLGKVEVAMVVAVLKGELTVEALTEALAENPVGTEEELEILLKGMLEYKNAVVEGERSASVVIGKNQDRLSTSETEQISAINGEIQSSPKSPCIGNASSSSVVPTLSLPLHHFTPAPAPCIASINVSCSRMGNRGLEILSELIDSDTPFLKSLDISFCNLDEYGLLAMCRSLRKRKKIGLPGLEGLILSGNIVSWRSARELGIALCCPKMEKTRQVNERDKEGAPDEDEEGDYDQSKEDDILGTVGKKSTKRRKSCSIGRKERKILRMCDKEHSGIQLLHMASTSLSSEGLGELLLGLGVDCQLCELNISSNNIGSRGLNPLIKFLEKKIPNGGKGKRIVMPKLDRIDLSNNGLGDKGTTELVRAISNRGQLSMVDLHLSSNDIGSGGTGTIMNKLLQHNLVSLSLDNNNIGDAGCQLVAGSLTSMHHLSHLNLSFNQIGSRGITSLMRALIGCESIQRLGLSGNIMKISGAIAMGFALAQHPRLSCLELDNCCLSQVSQCHIACGIISNRWVPMRTLHGFQVAPAMDVIGVPEVKAWHATNEDSELKNEECFSNRRNIQMKTILQWMETNRAAEKAGGIKPTASDAPNPNPQSNFLTVDFVPINNDANETPSQNAYLRMLDWLSNVPFDEEELADLRRYFYDAEDGGDGYRGSDGNINLKHRGDLLAALGSGLAEKMRQDGHDVVFPNGLALGLGIDDDSDSEDDEDKEKDGPIYLWNKKDDVKGRNHGNGDSTRKRDKPREKKDMNVAPTPRFRKKAQNKPGLFIESWQPSEKKSSTAESDGKLGKSEGSLNSQGEPKGNKSTKARITMFPVFMRRLELLESSAREMVAKDDVDENDMNMIAQLFAEKSLTLLRQLRYHCMNNGLDGWRQGKVRRKILIVDDSKITRKLVAHYFEKANFIVDTAENGEEGVRMLKESIYDIAFMDIDMPVMNGFDATKALREWEDVKRPGARQPICALTAAYVDDFEREELMKFKEAGLDVMESKPCNIPRLFKVVDDVAPMFSDLTINVTQQFDTATATC